MRKSKRLLDDGVFSKSKVTSSVDEPSSSKVAKKRKKLVLSKRVSNINDFSKSSSMNDENLDSETSLEVHVEGYESSGSSVNEFETPNWSHIETVSAKINVEEVDDFAGIEENILGDVSRLSVSEESEFEEIFPLPCPEKAVPRGGGANSPKTKGVLATNEPKDLTEFRRKRGRRTLKEEVLKVLKVASRNTCRKSSVHKYVKKKESPQGSESLKKRVVDVNQMDVTQLLALGESFAESFKEKSVVDIDEIEASADNESGGEGDWEEVAVDSKAKQEENPYIIPKEGVEITLDAPDLFHRKRRKGIDLAACLKRRLNRHKRGVQVLIHKVHLLCWISHGRYLNSVVNSQVLMGVALSILPSKHCYPPSRTDLNYLEKVVSWFRKTLPVVRHEEPQLSLSLEASLEVQFYERKARAVRDQVLMFVCAMRSLGIKARLVLSLQPAPLKPPSHELCSIGPRNSDSKKDAVEPSRTTEDIYLPAIIGDSPSTSKGTPKSHKTSHIKEEKVTLAGEVFEKKDLEWTKVSAKSKSKCFDEATKALPKGDESSGPFLKSRSQRCMKNQRCRKSGSSDCEEFIESKRKSVQKSAKAKHGKVSTTLVKSVGKNERHPLEDDSDFEPELLCVKRGKRIVVPAKDRKVLSSSSENEGQSEGERARNKREGTDVWAEVFLEMEEKWVSVDVPYGRVHCVGELHAKATSPVLYVLAFNNDMSLKDVSRRYCPQWLSLTQKKRVDEWWWKSTISPFCPPRNALDRLEEEEMDVELESRPMPSNINEYKGHPLYVLKRHLLKFEAIYPPDTAALGFIRGEPVYSRDCVHQLHSRETWIKEAKLVGLGEKPYKIVKARPKYDRMTGKVISNLPLELFGSWQVVDYSPPPAVGGKVPRNEYGNVDLYKPCMLPVGTVHLRLPALNRIAKKLQIDCASAVVGFDFHSGGSHPTFDGFIVCEEFKDILIDAWNQGIPRGKNTIPRDRIKPWRRDHSHPVPRSTYLIAREQEEQERRQMERREKRIYGNWTRLIRGLLIRESLRNKYSFGDVGESSFVKRKKGGRR